MLEIDKLNACGNLRKANRFWSFLAAYTTSNPTFLSFRKQSKLGESRQGSTCQPETQTRDGESF